MTIHSVIVLTGQLKLYKSFGFLGTNSSPYHFTSAEHKTYVS